MLRWILGSSLKLRFLLVPVAAAPLFFLQGVTSSFARPLAVTYLVAVLVSMVVALLVTPGLALLLSTSRAPARRSPLAGWLERGHSAALTRLLPRPTLALVAAVVLALAGLAVLPAVGGWQMLPPLRDRELLVQWEAAPGMSQPEMDRITALATRELRAIPGVRDVGAHVGRVITSDQVVNVNSAGRGRS